MNQESQVLCKYFIKRLADLTFSSRDPLYCWKKLTDLSTEARQLLKTLEPQKCAAKGNPADCDWPICGCDDSANKVIVNLQERDLLK